MSEPANEARKRRTPRIPAIRKSLAFLLLSLQGKNSIQTGAVSFHTLTAHLSAYISGNSVVIELKNDTEVSGIVEDVDAAMNVALSGAKHSLRDGSIVKMDSTTVKGPSIRYVHIPSKIRMRAQVSDYVKKLDRIRGQNKPSVIKDRPKLTAEPENKEDIVLS